MVLSVLDLGRRWKTLIAPRSGRWALTPGLTISVKSQSLVAGRLGPEGPSDTQLRLSAHRNCRLIKLESSRHAPKIRSESVLNGLYEDSTFFDRG